MNSNISSHRRCYLLSLALSVVFVLPVSQSPVQAAVYKCVAADGSTTYNDTPCAAEETIHRLSKTARKIDSLDCRIARNFAVDTVARMRQEDTVEGVYDVYGGSQQINEGTRNLINYVFSFSTDPKLSSKRIIELTVGRCESGLLGNTMDDCLSYPKEFISISGGCIAARKSDQTVLIQTNEDTAALDKGLAADQTEPTLNAAEPMDSLLEILDEHGATLPSHHVPTTFDSYIEGDK